MGEREGNVLQALQVPKTLLMFVELSKLLSSSY